MNIDRYVNFAPVIVADDTVCVDGPVYKEKHRSRVVRSPSALSDGATAAARAQTDLSDSSVNNTQADVGKKESSSKWHSVWDLRTDKEKKKKRKQHRQKIAQGLKDLMNIGDSAYGGESLGELVTSTPESAVEAKREKPKRPPPPAVAMSSIRDSYGFGQIGTSTTSSSAPQSANPEPKAPRPTPEVAAANPEPSHRYTKNTSGAAVRVPKPIAEIPKLPKGKKLLETVVEKDVDSLYRSMFENETFFEIVTKQTYDEVRNFGVTAWSTSTSHDRRRRMTYEFPKTIAFTRHEIKIEQVQTQASYCQPGRVYAVDCVTQNSGVMYSDYFEIHIHYRLTAEDNTRSRLVVMGDIIFVKVCLFKSRIETETWSGLKKYYEMLEREVQLEKVDHEKHVEDRQQSPDTIDSRPKSKNLKMSRSRSEAVLNREASPVPGNDNSLIFGEQTLGVAFLLIILTLLIITLALFKLSSAIAALSDRLGTIEELLERYAVVCLDPTFKLPQQRAV